MYDLICGNEKAVYICTRLAGQIEMSGKAKKTLLNFFWNIFLKRYCGIKKELYICTRLDNEWLQNTICRRAKERQKVHWDIEIDSVGGLPKGCPSTEKTKLSEIPEIFFESRALLVYGRNIIEDYTMKSLILAQDER